MGAGEEADRKAILQLVEEETAAYFEKDFERWARCWVQAPYVRRWMWFARGGVTVREGWEEQSERMRQSMALSPAPNPSGHEVRRENINLRVSKEMAWITFDQYASKAGDPFDVAELQQEMRVLEKHDGQWKIAYFCVFQRSLDHVDHPLLRVDSSAVVTWKNPAAAELVKDGSDLIVRAGRLRAVDRTADARLQAAIRWAGSLDDIASRGSGLPAAAKYGALPVVLGGGRGEPASVCWVIVDSGMILVSINDRRMTEERLAAAAAIYGISPAQIRLAAIIVAGRDLVQAAEQLGVSVSTARTHLQRMFDRTGARSQPALVRALLSVGAPGT